ncbi:unnamed protein product [Dicrocoelium dendriticum]|nr:unnamed protein product [Dicrocoelium dendriticum]
MADDFECSEYSQMQLVQMLTEVEQCMENAQTAAFLARSTKPAPRQPSDPCPPVPARIDPQDLIEVKAPGPRSAFLLPASSRSGDTTEYPDTLHSINTLTTEFAGYDSNRQQPRPAQHRRYLHCYHVYESDIAGAANSPHPHAGPMNPSSVDPV